MKAQPAQGRFARGWCGNAIFNVQYTPVKSDTNRHADCVRIDTLGLYRLGVGNFSSLGPISIL